MKKKRRSKILDTGGLLGYTITVFEKVAPVLLNNIQKSPAAECATHKSSVGIESLFDSDV